MLKLCVYVFTMSVFVKPLMDLIHNWHGDRNWSNILCVSSPTQYIPLRSRTQTYKVSEFLYKSFLLNASHFQFLAELSMNCSHVWHDEITLS